MITTMDTEREDAPPAVADTDGTEPGAPGAPADPAEASPSQETAGPAEGRVREWAVVRWVMPMWARTRGHTERLELTPTVRGAIDGGKLEVVGEVERETPPRRRRRG